MFFSFKLFYNLIQKFNNLNVYLYYKMEYQKLINKLNYSIKHFKFDKFTKFIQNKFLIKKVNEFLKYLDINVKAQLFLTIYLIEGFNKHILNKDYQDTVLIKVCNQIVKHINFIVKQDDNKTKLLIKKLVLIFNNKFFKWKKKDIEYQLEYYASCYYEYQEILNKNYSDIYNKEVKKLQNKLKEKIIKFQNGEEFLKKYKTIFDEKLKLEKQILLAKLTKTMKDAFWNNLQNDLEQQNLTQIPDLLKDINTSLKLLINNKTYKENIDEHIDYQFIKQLIEKNQFKHNNIFNLGNFILTCLQELGMAENDNEIEELKKWLLNEKVNKDFKLSIFLPKFFKEVMERIEKIQLRILQIKKSIENT